MVKRDRQLKFVVESQLKTERADKWLAKQLAPLSRTRIQQLLVEGHVLLNGEVCVRRSILKPGDVVHVSMPEDKRTVPLRAKAGVLDVVYEDDDVIVVNKPSGMVVHPGAGTDGSATLTEILLSHTKGKLSQPEGDRPGIVHRLDKDTTGLLVCAKNDESHGALAEQFGEKSADREYLALLDGLISQREVTIESFLTRDPRRRTAFMSVAVEAVPHPPPSKYRWARSVFSSMSEFGHCLTLSKVILATGRTHQIRVHSAHLKAPVVGDPLYNRPRSWPGTFSTSAKNRLSAVARQMLHAKVLGFKHPRTGQMMRFESDLPADFSDVLNILEPYRVDIAEPRSQ